MSYKNETILVVIDDFEFEVEALIWHEPAIISGLPEDSSPEEYDVEKVGIVEILYKGKKVSDDFCEYILENYGDEAIDDALWAL